MESHFAFQHYMLISFVISCVYDKSGSGGSHKGLVNLLWAACDSLSISGCAGNPDRLKILCTHVTLFSELVDRCVYYGAEVRRTDLAITEIRKYVGRDIYYEA